MLAYTNHTLLSEALEKWPIARFAALSPRHVDIVCEINRGLLDDVASRHPGDRQRVRRASRIENEPARMVRMVHLAVGTHSTNGVVKIHSD